MTHQDIFDSLTRNAGEDASMRRYARNLARRPRALDGRLPPACRIEAKGRAKGQTTITVTRNEILYGLDQSGSFILAIVMVDDEQHEAPFHVRQPFTQEPDWAVTSVNPDLAQLLSRASQPETTA